MGKKGSWFSAIKRVFTHESKDKPSYGSDKRGSKERKGGKGVLHQGETKSFISRFREPSSIEKILGEADELLVRPPASTAETKKIPPPSWRPASPPLASSPSVSHRATSPNATSQRVSSNRFTSSPRPILPPAQTQAPEVSQSRWEIRYVQRPETTLRNQHRSATMIQAAFRGYLARRNFRALRGLVRLQGVVRSPNAQRQTMNAMKQMQLLVRVQTQIQSRRIQMLETQNQAYRNTKDVDGNLSKWALNQLTRPQTNASNHKHVNTTTDSHEPVTPLSTRSTIVRAKTPQPAALNYNNYSSSKPRRSSGYDCPLRDDESLSTCPPFSTPNYMTPTASAKAKARANSNPKERLPGTPANESKRRFSFSLSSNIGSLKWNKGSVKESGNQKAMEKHVSSNFGGDLSVDSTVSMPAAVGRRPFNRFV